jgi:hypothetical protein
MSRSTNILGFAFLAIAATLAMSITMRNSPAPPNKDSGSGTQSVRFGGARSAPVASVPSATLRRQAAARTPAPDPLKVSLAEDWLATLSPNERQDWLDRTATVEREACGQLEKLTTSLDLNSTQRRKLFPALVRASAGYDSAMTVAGVTVTGDSTLTPAEEIHSLLESDQQAQLEDDEVQRQLWWQDIIGKLEADLTDATGGGPSDDGTPPPAVPVPGDERVAPETREGGNLFDRLDP